MIEITMNTDIRHNWNGYIENWICVKINYKKTNENENDRHRFSKIQIWEWGTSDLWIILTDLLEGGVIHIWKFYSSSRQITNKIGFTWINYAFWRLDFSLTYDAQHIKSNVLLSCCYMNFSISHDYNFSPTRRLLL